MAGAVASLLATLVVQLPLGAALVAGFVLAVMRRRRHPRAAALVMVGIVLVFVALILTTGLRSFGGFLNVFAHDTTVAADQVNLVFVAVNVIAGLLAAVAWILAAVAVVSRPGPSEPRIGTSSGADAA
ncbi:hypothetical protein [Fodinicola feengrottensis]|uniref:Integral membrane protein n=1 Tax=Fodinicola feengrottensis TaxID=435914 RepID=A0ABN2J831_9ACTN|nr:hypothetical protein [Fodinicola feengrottensis]